MKSRARTESVKLISATINAMAILLIATGVFGDWVNPEILLHPDSRGWMVVAGIALHGISHIVLSQLDQKDGSSDD